ncbi:MAG: cytochrome c biogenesis protein ResB [Chloroflexota bacterium]|nr:cytochrome c biogenesis protein ResB [Chloroflexota bacterium]
MTLGRATTWAGAGTRILDRLWWFFTSVRVALWLIGVTGCWALVSTLGQSALPGLIARHVPALAGAMSRWQEWEVWRSPPFLATLGLLAVSTVLGGIVCRWPGIQQQIRRPGVRATPRFFTTGTYSRSLVVSSPAAAMKAFECTLRGKHYRVLNDRDKATGTVHLYADKHRYSLLATLPLHAAFVLLMVGAVIVDTFGWRDLGVLIPDGSTRAIGHGAGLAVKSIRFVDIYDDNGRPRDFYSDLEIFKDGRLVKAGRLRVNSPLSYDGVSLHQETFGQTAQFRIADEATGATLFDDGIPLFVSADQEFAKQFMDRAGEPRPTGERLLDDHGLLLRIVGSGGFDDDEIGMGQVAIAIFDNRAVRRGAGPIWLGVLDPGEAQTFGGVTYTYKQSGRFTGLQITSAPGMWIIYLSAAIIFASLLVMFYLPRRCVRALVVPVADGSWLMRIGAQVNPDPFGVREVERIKVALCSTLAPSSARASSSGGGRRRHRSSSRAINRADDP